MSSLDDQAPRKIPLRRKLLFIAIIYSAFLVVLLSVEVICRIALTHVDSLELFVGTRQQKMQVANEKQSGIFEGDPLLLWRLKPNLHDAVWDFTVLSTNAQSFRADYPIGTKLDGTFRIICLGDSVTFGYRVPVIWPDKPTEYDREWLPFAMLVQKHLREANAGKSIEVFPMAVPGYTSHQGLAWLRRDIGYLKPDVVIVSYGWNDASLSDVPDRDAIRTDWYPVAVRWLINHSQAFAHATKYLRSQNAPPTGNARPRPVPRVSDKEYVQNLEAIVRLATDSQAKVIVMGAPYRDSTTNPPEAQLMTTYRGALRNSMNQRGIPYLEILELTETAGSVNEGFFGELIHPNHMGHRLIAAELIKLMKQKQMLGDLRVPEFQP